MNGDQIPESPELRKARATETAEKASDDYSEKTTRSESTFQEKMKNLFSGKTLSKAAILEGLDLLPFLAGYSVADLYVAGEGVVNLIEAVQKKDLQKGLKGVLKIGVAAAPGVPASGIAPALDALLPDREDPRETAAKQGNVTNQDQV